MLPTNDKFSCSLQEQPSVVRWKSAVLDVLSGKRHRNNAVECQQRDNKMDRKTSFTIDEYNVTKL